MSEDLPVMGVEHLNRVDTWGSEPKEDNGWIRTTDRLPENNTYVLTKYNGGNWLDRDDPEHCSLKVMKFKRGLTVAERAALPDGPQKKTYSGYDEQSNNLKGYGWESFGPGSFHGQDVDFWQPLTLPPMLRDQAS